MAEERLSLNQDKLDALKQEMNYTQFIRQLPPDKRVILDWQALLSVIKDDEGIIWRTHSEDASYGYQAGHGRLKTHLRSDSVNITIVAHSLSQGQKEAIDAALFDATNSNAPFVPYKFEPHCFSTLCLIPRQQDVVESILFVYGNIMIDLVSSDSEYNVLPFARALHAAMQKAVAANPEGKLPARPHVSYTVNPTRVKVGENFTVTAKFDGSAQLDPKTFRVAKKLISSNIEYQKNLGAGVYKFTAKAAGMGTAAFGLFDKKTLWVFNDNVTVHIDPAQSK